MDLIDLMDLMKRVGDGLDNKLAANAFFRKINGVPKGTPNEPEHRINLQKQSFSQLHLYQKVCFDRMSI